MNGTFVGASSFNQPLNSWIVSGVTDMQAMFTNAVAFNQDISSWNVSNVTDMTIMLLNTAFSTTNLNAIYNTWSTLPTLKSNVRFGAPVCYSSSASAGRAVLTGTYNWIITDGGVC
jgi:surface protein